MDSKPKGEDQPSTVANEERLSHLAMKDLSSLPLDNLFFYLRNSLRLLEGVSHGLADKEAGRYLRQIVNNMRRDLSAYERAT
jgi:hypothetical protein